MDHSNIFKPKMFDSRQIQRIGEEKSHPLHTPEKSQQPRYTGHTKSISAKKNQVSFHSEDEYVPDGIPLKPVHHKRTLHRASKAPAGVSSQHSQWPMNGATDVNGARQSRGDPEKLPAEQRRMAKVIHTQELLIQEKLLRVAQSMRDMIIQDGDSSEMWSGEADRRRDLDMRTEGRVGNPHERKREKGDTQEGKAAQKALPRRPGREEQPDDHGTRAGGHLNRRTPDGMEVMGSNGDEERSKRSVHLPAQRRGESQWSQARANEEEKEEQPEQGWERKSTWRHDSSWDEKEPPAGRRRSVRERLADHHSSKEGPRLPRSSRPQVADPIPELKTEAPLQLLSCIYCERRFAPARLDKHLTICERLHQSQRKVYDSSKHRIQGTEMEKFRRNRPSISSEVKKNIGSQKQVSNRNQAGHSVQNGPDQVTCPHCSRRFAPGPAERHIPKCQNIRSRPPPPRCRQ